ncbi:Rieske (2Fe-2S) protein [Nocardioides donggukensis]|uniref:Cytochrome bc1 complex Rieske iron-sulfur subunit n=1 Tax=Nocardioides donggukensis TaxID=2774019 RepID=A0A927K2X1_9ACTN|nr:Rieske (2Fe-2S) protein [Nocardioides donggukensis]MBD8869364.1 Rieske (2Fe-2S) protein [Nocardioides donggukensis]
MSLNRRHVLGSGAVLGLSLPVLAACGGDSGDGGDSSGADSGADSGSGDGGGDAPDAGSSLASTDQVPVGGGVILAEVVLTQPTEGEFKAFTNVCTHQGCKVSSVETTINCQCHGSAFSITDGSVEAGPANAPLEEVAITVDGDEISTA